MNVWVISELYYPEDTSTGYFMTGIAEGLAARFATSVICSQPTYAARGTTAPWRETHDGVDIHRVRATRLNPHGIAGRIINFLTISISIAFAALRHVRKGDVVIVVTNPPALPPLIRWASSLRGAKPVLLVHDVYPEVLKATGLMKASSLRYRIASRLAKSLYRGFDRVVVLGRDMRALIAAKLGSGDRIVEIANWGDTAAIRPRTGPNALRDRLGLTDKFVVQYAGNIGRSHGIDALIAAAEALSDDPAFHLLVIGAGARKKEIEDAVRSRALQNITLMPFIPREELPLSLTACDVALVAMMPGMKGVSVPSRLYNILAAGKPVIAMGEPDSELGLVVSESGAGWVVPPGDSAALVDAIRNARSDASSLESIGARGRAAAEARWTPAHAIERWTALVEDLIR